MRLPHFEMDGKQYKKIQSLNGISSISFKDAEIYIL